jgi:hypothetical protein
VVAEVDRQPVSEVGVDDSDTATVIEVPGEPRSLRLLRLAAADAAASVGFDVERIESARLVVDELASVLITAGRGGRLRVCITRGADEVGFEGTVRTDLAEEVELGLIVRELLDVTIGRDAWSVDQSADRVSFRASVPARRRH